MSDGRVIDAGAMLCPRCCGDEAWIETGGAGVVAGLLDTRFVHDHPDLEGAALIARDFTAVPSAAAEMDHGTASVALLVGQGHHRFRGIAPRARLLVAEVVGANGVASWECVVEAIDWLVASGARVLALPLGQPDEVPAISRSIERAAAASVLIFGAAGHAGLAQPLFPARHPAVISVGSPEWKMPVPVSAREIETRGGSSIACVAAAGVAILAAAASSRAAPVTVRRVGRSRPSRARPGARRRAPGPR